MVIDTRQSDSKFAKRYFHQLKEQKENIEQEFGDKLNWDERPDKSATRIYASYPIRITDTPEIKESAKMWAVENIQRLVDTMQPRITELTTEPPISSEISDDWE